MKVCLDEGGPEAVAEFLPGHDVESVRALGLKGVKNGKLLAQVEARGFEAFISNDKRLEAEGQLRQRTFGTLILSVSNWELIEAPCGEGRRGVGTCRAWIDSEDRLRSLYPAPSS